MNLRDLAALWQTHTILRQEVRQHLSRIITVLFCSLGFDVSHILNALEDIGGIVFGSVVLSLLNGCHFKPRSLDVIVPIDCANKFIENVTKSYSLNIDPQVPVSMLSLPDVRNVIVLSGAQKPLNIVITRSKNVFKPLFASHSSAAMNYLTKKEIYCAYPDLTFRYRNVLNSTTVRSLTWNAKKFASCLAKYEKWGYTCYATLVNWSDFNHHICGVETSCPKTPRWIRDGSGFRFLLSRESTDGYQEFTEWQLNDIHS